MKKGLLFCLTIVLVLILAGCGDIIPEGAIHSPTQGEVTEVEKAATGDEQLAQAKDDALDHDHNEKTVQNNVPSSEKESSQADDPAPEAEVEDDITEHANQGEMEAPAKEQQVIVEDEVHGDLEVHFIDVDQGDATLFLGPDFTMLIDAGRHDRSDVVPYLESVGVEHIDLFVLTHPFC